jgi:hypothetical protein
MFVAVEIAGDATDERPTKRSKTAFRPSTEANMMTIRHPAAETADHSARSSLDASERRPHQTGLRRTKAAYHFPLYALHGDERRAGKTAKLLDLYARLNLGAL